MLQRNSAQEQFAAAVQALQANWAVDPRAAHLIVGGIPSALLADRDIFSLLDRLASDHRMQPIWALLLPYPLEATDWFLVHVVWSAVAARALPTARSRIQERLRDIASARAAVRTLRKLGSRPIVISSTLATAVPGYTKTLDAMEYVLFHSERLFRADLEKPIPRKDRGVRTQRAEFMRNLIFWTNRLFGKPRYEDVATLANVIFDSGSAAIAETARSAARKRDKVRLARRESARQSGLKPAKK